MNREQKLSKADRLEAEAKTLRDAASEDRKAELRAQPLNDRLIYAAYDRCECGAGMAYDPASGGDVSSPFRGPSKWECSDILRFSTFASDYKVKVKAATHTAPLPFAFYEVKSENQPSASGATTRERVQAAA